MSKSKKRKQIERFYADPKRRRAADDASESDRIFFEEHPHRTMRVRKALPGELPDPKVTRADIDASIANLQKHGLKGADVFAKMAAALPDDANLIELILVHQIRPGARVRVRFPFCFAEKAPADMDLDQMFPERLLKQEYPPAFWDEFIHGFSPIVAMPYEHTRMRIQPE